MKTWLLIALAFACFASGEHAIDTLKAKIIAQDGIASPATLSVPVVAEQQTQQTPVVPIVAIQSDKTPQVSNTAPEETTVILAQPGMQIVPLPSQLMKNSQLSVPVAESPLNFPSKSDASSNSNSLPKKTSVDILVQTAGKTMQQEFEIFGLPLRIWISGAIYLCLVGFAGVVFSRRPTEAALKLLILLASTVAFLFVVHDRKTDGAWQWKLILGVVLIFGFLAWNIIDMVYMLQGPLHSANNYFKDLHWESIQRNRKTPFDDDDNTKSSTSPQKSLSQTTTTTSKADTWTDINNQLISALQSAQAQEVMEEQEQQQEEEIQEQEDGEEENEVEEDILHLNLSDAITSPVGIGKETVEIV